MLGLLLVGLIPFAVMGIMLGHLHPRRHPRTGDRRRDVALRAARRGLWTAVRPRARLLTVVKVLPSYWLVQAGKSALGGATSGRPRRGS